jgi:recombination protein RecA
MAQAKKSAHSAASLEQLTASINGAFGAGAIMKYDNASVAPVSAISTGSIALDAALGVGGLPAGRVIEIYGPEATGKTTIALHAIANVQRAGGIAVFVDAEHALNRDLCIGVGVNPDTLLISQPSSGEEGLEITDMAVRSGSVDLVVVDSVAALTPLAEIEGRMGDQLPGLQARLMGQGMRKITSGMSPTGTTVIFINQLREKIGIMFGNPETTPGGKALKFYASVRLDVRRIQALKDGGMVYGNRLRVKVIKNKVAPPSREAEFDLIYGHGIYHAGELVDLGASYGVVVKKGAFYGYEGTTLGQGRANAALALQAEPDKAAAIEVQIRAAIASGAQAIAPEPVPAAQLQDPAALLPGPPPFA